MQGVFEKKLGTKKPKLGDILCLLLGPQSKTFSLFSTELQQGGAKANTCRGLELEKPFTDQLLKDSRRGITEIEAHEVCSTPLVIPSRTSNLTS